MAIDQPRTHSSAPAKDPLHERAPRRERQPPPPIRRPPSSAELDISQLATEIVAEDAIQSALNQILFESIRPAALIVAVVYCVFAALDLFLWRPSAFWVHWTLTIATAVALFGLAYLLKHRRIPISWASPLAIGIAVLASLRVLWHMFDTPPTASVANISLYVLTIGCFLLSWRVLAVIVATMLSLWLGYALSVALMPDWIASTYVLLGGSTLAFLVQTVRVTSLRKREEMRLGEAQLRGKLTHTIEAMRSAETRVRELADAAPMMIGIIDVHGRTLYTNKGWRDFVDSTKGQFAEDNWSAIVHRDDAIKCYRTFRRAVRHRKEFHLELRLRRADGHFRWMLAQGRPKLSSSGEVQNYVATAVDIDARRRAEQALQKKEADHQALLNAMPDVLLRVDHEGQFLDYHAREGLELIVPAKNFLGKRTHDVLGQELADRGVQRIRDALSSGKVELVEFQLTRTGELQPHVFEARLVKCAEREVLAAVRDITAQRRAEQATRESESRFRRLFEANIIGMIFAETRKWITDVNDEFLKITGYSRSDLPLDWRKLTPPEFAHLDELALLKLRDTAVAEPWEKEYFRKDGTRVPILVGVAMLQSNSEECVAFVLDLTDRKAAEEKIRDLDSKLQHIWRVSTMGQLTAGVAHELHQPLTAIANYANGCVHRLQKGTVNKDELIELMKVIAGHAIRAGGVLKRIRGFLQRREPIRKKVDINFIINETIQLVLPDNRRHQVQISFEPNPELPLVLADNIQITQVLMNLLLNAIEAMSKQATPRKIQIAVERSGEQFVEVSVTDTGPGISLKNRDTIFQEFYSTKEHGLGMGLSISRTMIESHEGRLWLDEQNEISNTFRFTLPVEGYVFANRAVEFSQWPSAFAGKLDNLRRH